MNPALVADSIVDLCGALGLGIAMLTLRRRDPHGPLTARFLFALGLVTALFLLRGLGWWTGSLLLERLALACAAGLPLGALVVAEGVLRRHAPRWLKIAVLGGATLLALASLAGFGDHGGAYDVMLAGFQLASFAACGVLLFSRDCASLTAAENGMIGRLALCAFLVLPFLLSDFRGIATAMPVRLGGLGALFLISIVLVTGGGAQTRRQGFALMALRASAALALGWAAAYLDPDIDLVHGIRMCAVMLAGVLTIGLMADALNGAFEARSPGVLASIAQSRAGTREELIARLTSHPLFESAVRLREPALAEFDPPILKEALREVSVLRAADQPWQRAADDGGTERIAALLATYSASHLLVVVRDPLDLLVLTVPVVSADPATETALSLARRLLANAPTEAA
ncbi:hypothetical protein [Bosea sp. BK604]|uniref:hypothetical protein n=1 Tax=Bosea sp. BK604 TaxID=2512180 RepID=UPI0010534738|nr:hypothetical protein [Bosea sp. BK604]TCR69660.1 hypothetical protein EV560_10155 [Bosea sp. BK604]